MTLIPYAGFDPFENDFDNIQPAPLHEQDIEPRTHFDIARIWSLKHSGKSWNEIGKLLASEEGRRAPYQGTSIKFAVNKGRGAA